MVPTYGLVAFISMPGGGEMIILGIIGLLIFGSRLPEVAKSLGKSVVEFKKGLSGVQDEIERSVSASQQTDILPPPSSAPASSESSVEFSKTSVESSVSSAETAAPSESSAAPDVAPDAAPVAEVADPESPQVVGRTLGPNGEWNETPR